jgi:alcohol dehydrogenase
VTALTGIDAISHAIETYVSTRRNPISVTYGRRAFGLLASGFGKVLRDPGDLEARGEMQLGACFAGMSIETSMLGAAHATANPLTARYGVVHGQAVGLMLPAVIRMNGTVHGDWYAELLREVEPGVAPDEAADALAARVETWLREAGLATRLEELSVPASAIDSLAEDSLTQWTGTFNPIPLNHDLAGGLYRSVTGT